MDRRFPAATTAALVVPLLVALGLWQGDASWDFSEGVYAVTARLVADGATLYEDVAAAQPPALLLTGAGLLSVDDSLAALRVGMSLAELATALLVALGVWRLTASRTGAVAAGVLAVLTPWSLHGHAQLVPETLAAPLLLGAALAAARRPVLAGALGALAATTKVLYVLPAAAVVLAVRTRARGVLALTAVGGVLGLLALAVFGGGLWDQVVTAQRQVGTHGLRYVAELGVQAGWNLVPLLVPAALAWPLRARARDDETLRAVGVLALASLAALLSVVKDGTYLQGVAVAEPPLLVLAASAAVWVAREASARRTLVAACAAFGAVQAVGLLAAPADAPLFTRPGAEPAGAALTDERADELAAAARTCPPDVPYPYPPFVAFLADRRMPGDQPDLFIIAEAPVTEPFARRALADRPTCPAS